jgi:hypothetical protein
MDESNWDETLPALRKLQVEILDVDRLEAKSRLQKSEIASL